MLALVMMRPMRVPESLYHRGAASPGTTRLRYLGTAGFVLETAGRTIAIDPFVTRTGLRDAARGPLVPDAERIRRLIPRADDVLIGHAHYDHVLDAPVLCQQTGARLIGSRAACSVGRAAGLPESQLVETGGREEITCGPVRVRGLPSRHGRVFLNRVPIPGDLLEPPAWPPRARDLPHGLVFCWYLETSDIRVVHIGSAELIESELRDTRADVLCLCAIGRRNRRDYVARAVDILRPRVVVACHWDAFFFPIEAENTITSDSASSAPTASSCVS